MRLVSACPAIGRNRDAPEQTTELRENLQFGGRICDLQRILRRQRDLIRTTAAEKKMADDDDVVDPMPPLEKDCHGPCVAMWKQYELCAKRIEGDESGEKHCTGYYLDYWHCNHHCVGRHRTLSVGAAKPRHRHPGRSQALLEAQVAPEPE
jgi:ubiquinol-cytochrome c reductase subunit 6